MYADIPSVMLGHHRSMPPSPRWRKQRPPAAPPANDPCELTAARLASLGQDLAGTLREKSCNAVPLPPKVSKDQYRHLAASGLEGLRQLQPQHQARDTCIYGFSVAFLHVLIVCVVAPSFFYWYYRWRYLRQYRAALGDHLRTLSQQVLGRAGAVADHPAALSASLGAREVLELAGTQLERRYMAALQAKNVNTLNNSVVKYRSLYLGIAFFLLTVILFVIWQRSPYRLPVGRVLLGAVLFAVFLCVYEYIFFEYVYLQFMPLQTPLLDGDLYDIVSNDLALALGVPTDQPAHDPEFVKQVQKAHRLWHTRQARQEQLRRADDPTELPADQAKTKRSGVVGALPDVMLARQPAEAVRGALPAVRELPAAAPEAEAEAEAEVRERPVLVRADNVAHRAPPLVPEFYDE